VNEIRNSQNVFKFLYLENKLVIIQIDLIHDNIKTLSI
jgi:hypothetical protein